MRLPFGGWTGAMERSRKSSGGRLSRLSLLLGTSIRYGWGRLRETVRSVRLRPRWPFPVARGQFERVPPRPGPWSGNGITARVRFSQSGGRVRLPGAASLLAGYASLFCGNLIGPTRTSPKAVAGRAVRHLLAGWNHPRRRQPFRGRQPLHPAFRGRVNGRGKVRSFHKWFLWATIGIVFLPCSGLPAQQNEGRAAFEHAQKLQSEGKLREAVEIYKEILTRHPDDVPTLNGLGSALVNLKQYREGIAAYKKALARRPNDPAISLNLGLAYFKAGDFSSAIQPFRTVVAAQPDSIQARTLLGMSLYGTHRFAEAAQNLEVVARRQPGNTQLLFTLAQCYLASKQRAQRQKALAIFEKLEKDNPQSAATHMLLGEALDASGRTAEAIREFEIAAKSSPPPPQVHFAIGYLYWKTKRFEQARQAFQAELKDNPSNAKAEAYLADIYVRRQQFQQALPLLQKATRQDNGIRIAWLDLGIVYTHQRQFPKAVQALKTAIRLDPSQTDSHYRLAMAYYAAGQTEEAKAELAIVNRMHAKSDQDSGSKVSGAAPNGPSGQP